jgi:hypothetical protein
MLLLFTAVASAGWLALAGVDSVGSQLAVTILVVSVPAATVLLLWKLIVLGRNALAISPALHGR